MATKAKKRPTKKPINKRKKTKSLTEEHERFQVNVREMSLRNNLTSLAGSLIEIGTALFEEAYNEKPIDVKKIEWLITSKLMFRGILS